SDNRVKLESDTHFAVVSKEYKGEPREKWLLTAYEKKETSEPANSRMDVESNLEGKSDDTATRRDSDVSGGKVTDNSSNRQVNGVKNSGIEDDVSIAERKVVEDKAKRNATGLAMEQTIPQKREQVSDQGGVQESVGIEDLQVRKQKTGSSASDVTEAERALRDELNNVLTRAGIEVVTDVEEGQRVLDEANGKVKFQAILSNSLIPQCFFL
ncbi:MAG: hypothetical protein ACOCN5_09510, partial [Prevotella sp.]